MQRTVPFIAVLKNYQKEHLLRDMLAGVTVSVVLIPQAMSYALIAGLPPVYGLYAACIPPIIAALFGKSSQLATGPVAIVSLLTFSSVLPYAKPGTPEFIAMAINLAAIVGTFQILMGIFKLGFIMRFVSHPVIVGFANAGAIIIAATQIKHLLGIEVKDSEFIFPILVDIAKNIIHTNPYTLAIGALSLAIIIIGSRLHKSFPGAMIAALTSVLISYFIDIRRYGVDIIGAMPAGLPSFSLPFMEYLGPLMKETANDLPHLLTALTNLESIFRLIGPGIIIAIVGFMEAMAITKSIAERTKEPVDLNQELIGQGAANLVGAYFKSYPVSGSFSRSAVNLQAGGITALSNVFSGMLVILTLLFFTSTFYYLPKATLAAIVISAVIGLVQQEKFPKLYRTNKTDGIVAMVTFTFAFLTKPDYAIFIGIALSLLLFLWESMSPRIITLTRDPRSEVFVNAETKNLPTCPQILYIMPDFSVYFANAEFFREHVLDKIRAAQGALKCVLLDLEMVNKIDATGVDELKEMIHEMNAMGVDLYVMNVKAPVRSVLENAKVRDMLKQKRWYISKADSITRLFNQIDYDYCRNTCPNIVFWECETVKYPLCKTGPGKQTIS